MSLREPFRELRQIGNYRLGEFLGQGQFAQVYLGEHIYLGTKAAVKVLHSNLGDEEKKRFIQEARFIATLRHPNIVGLLDFGLEGDTPYLIMEYASGRSLRQHYPPGTLLPLETVVSYVKQIAAALQYAHHHETGVIIHRDVKPENILLASTSRVLLSDFGIAKMVETAHDQSLQTISGTIPYMAPEQLQGKPCPASDQYSLGIITYELLSGSRPFKGSRVELLAQHSSAAPPPPLPDRVLIDQPTIKREVERVVLKALARNPEERYENVEAFAHALEEASKASEKKDKELYEFNKAIRLNPQNPQLYMEMADVFIKRASYDDALACYEEAIHLDPQNPQFHREKATVLLSLSRVEDALASYDRAINLDPQNPFIYKEKGDVLRGLNRLYEAISCYSEVTRLNPRFGLAYQSIGEIHEQLAMQAYERARALGVSQPKRSKFPRLPGK